MASLPTAVYLMTNDGRGSTQGFADDIGGVADPNRASWTYDLTPHIVEMEALSWEIDKELTRISPGSLSLKIADPEEKLWNWLEKQVLRVDGALPPFLFYDIGDQRRFLGILPLSQCSRLRAERRPTLEATDWSLMLSNVLLQGEEWERPWPKSAIKLPPAETRDCTINARRIKRLISDEFAMDDAFDMPGMSAWLKAGDIVRVEVLPWSKYKGMTETYKVLSVNGNRAYVNGLRSKVGGLYDRHSPHPKNVRVTKYGAGFDDEACFKVMFTVESKDDKPNHVLTLHTVDGIIIGDKLELLGPDKATFTVSQIDVINSAVICQEEVTIQSGNYVYLSRESKEQLVFEDCRTLIHRAVGKYFTVNLDKFIPAFLPIPAFSWLPLRPANGFDTTPVSDIENTGSGLRIFSEIGMAFKEGVYIRFRSITITLQSNEITEWNKRSWVGNPSDGWQVETDSAKKYATWTDQRTSAPNSLLEYLPDEYGQLRNETEAPTIPAGKPAPKLTMADYASNAANSAFPLRQLTFDGMKIQIQTPSGTQTATWDNRYAVGTFSPESVCPCIGKAGFVCGVSGDALSIAQVPGSRTRSVSISDLPKGRVLKTTPWGIYLITDTSYSRIIPKFSGDDIADITIQTSILTNQRDAQLYPNTFVGIDPNTVAIFGCFSAFDPWVTAQDRKEETHLLILKAYPVMATDDKSGDLTDHPTVISADRILDGRPKYMGCTRDPSALNRVVGHCGGQLFQIARRLPWTIEKFTPGEMTAIELVEHICQLQMAVAFPDMMGTLHIISRNLNESPTVLELPRSVISTEENVTWEQHASYIVVSGANDDAVGDCDPKSCIQGGTVMEISGHPMIHSSITAKAIAEAYAQVFGIPRKYRKQEFVWLDTWTAAPWLCLEPFPAIAIKCCPDRKLCKKCSETSNWILTGVTYSEATGKGELTMIEQVDSLWGHE